MPAGMADSVPQIYRFALRLTGDRHEAEDLSQEAMLKIWKNRAQLKDERAARVWMFRIVANLWKDRLRRSGNTVAKAGSLEYCGAGQLTASTASPEAGAENQEELNQALAMLAALPERQRTVLHLVAVEQLGLSDVCEILGVDKSAARASLSLARRKMREAKAQAE